MKYIVASLLSLFSIVSSAQVDLDSFYLQGSNWTEYEYLSAGQGTGGWYGYKYLVGHDSLVNTYSYHLIYIAQTGQCTPIPWWNNPTTTCGHGPNDDQYSLVGGIRVQGRKVYFINLSGGVYNNYQPGQDSLAYNFDLALAVGDTIPGTYKVIQGIDSVQLSDGRNLKKYIFEYYNNLYQDYWIEALGSRAGFLGSYTSIFPTPVSYHALCYNADSDPVHYHFPDSSTPGNIALTCFDVDQYTGVKSAKVQNKELSIYPNPVEGNILHLDGNTDDIAGMEIYDALGRLSSAYTKITGDSVPISLPGGFYYVRFYLKDHTTLTRQFCKVAD